MKRFVHILLAVTLVAVSPSFGGQFLGGKGYLHTVTAMNMAPSTLDVSFFLRGFVYTNSELGRAVTNGTSALNATFGFTRNVEVGLSQILYQDLNQTRKALVSSIIPGDTYFRFKFGNYPLFSNAYWAVTPVIRYAVAQYHDVQFEPYESVANEFELDVIASYFEKPLYPDDGYSVHLNLGYINHNDVESITLSSMQISYLASFLYPREKFDYGLELYGSYFFQKPPVNVLSRESWTYVTPFVRFKSFSKFEFLIGLDILLSGHEDTTVDTDFDTDLYPNYAIWRLTGRIKYYTSTPLVSTPTFGLGSGQISRSTPAPGETIPPSGGGGGYYNRQALFRWAVEERTGDVEAIDLDLEKIRMERKKAEEDLQKLKEELERKKAKQDAKK